MIGKIAFLKGYQPILEGHISFGDSVKRRVLGNRTLDVDGLPRLKNVLHVEGLKAYLIIISQLCYQNLVVKFMKNTCKVFNKSEECLLEGPRS